MLVIVGILSAFAGVRILDQRFAGTRAFYDGVVALVQYGRKTAIAQRRPVFVQVSPGAVVLCYSTVTPCNAPVAGPPGAVAGANPLSVSFTQSPFTVSAPAGVAFTPALTFQFQFDALGSYLTDAGALPGANLTLTVQGDSSYSLTVERITGYVHP